MITLYKKTVDVVVLWKQDKSLIPLFIVLDGQKYQVDRILKDPVQSASVTGGTGLKYFCLIAGKKENLFYEQLHERWFIESTKP